MITEFNAIDIVSSGIEHVPFDVISMSGVESVDFLHRIATSDFSRFSVKHVQHTCFVSDKGRIIDTVWVLHRGDHLLIAASAGMASTIVPWLNKYIIMEDISVRDVSSEVSVSLIPGSTSNGYPAEYFGSSVNLMVKKREEKEKMIPSHFEEWRIQRGIPRAGKEIVQEYNPLELNLWEWISFTKGCYIGQEVIARLDTYNKIQRSLCRFTSGSSIREQEGIVSSNGKEVGRITSIVQSGEQTLGLAMVRLPSANIGERLTGIQSGTPIVIDHVFRKGNHGTN